MPRQLGRVACRQRAPQLSRIEPTSHPALTIRVPAPVGEGRALHTSSNPGTACPAGGTPTAGGCLGYALHPRGHHPSMLTSGQGLLLSPTSGWGEHTHSPPGSPTPLDPHLRLPSRPRGLGALAPFCPLPAGSFLSQGVLIAPACPLQHPGQEAPPGGSLTLASIQLTCPTSTPGVGYLNQILSLARAQVPSGLGWFPNIQGACPTSTPGIGYPDKTCSMGAPRAPSGVGAIGSARLVATLGGGAIRTWKNPPGASRATSNSQ